MSTAPTPYHWDHVASAVRPGAAMKPFKPLALLTLDNTTPDRAARIRELHLRKAEACAQKADLFELEGDAKRRAKDPIIRLAGICADCAAADLREAARQSLIIVTALSDYSDASDTADLRFHLRLAELSYQCRPTETGSPQPIPDDPRIATFLAA